MGGKVGRVVKEHVYRTHGQGKVGRIEGGKWERLGWGQWRGKWRQLYLNNNKKSTNKKMRTCPQIKNKNKLRHRLTKELVQDHRICNSIGI